jgi:hypothetical protein
VNTCLYCGTSNEESLQFCQICGKELSLPGSERIENQRIASDLAPKQRVLNASRATKILLAYIGAQIIAGIPGGILVSLMGDGSERTQACLACQAQQRLRSMEHFSLDLKRLGLYQRLTENLAEIFKKS